MNSTYYFEVNLDSRAAALGAALADRCSYMDELSVAAWVRFIRECGGRAGRSAVNLNGYCKPNIVRRQLSVLGDGAGQILRLASPAPVAPAAGEVHQTASRLIKQALDTLVAADVPAHERNYTKAALRVVNEVCGLTLEKRRRQRAPQKKNKKKRRLYLIPVPRYLDTGTVLKFSTWYLYMYLRYNVMLKKKKKKWDAGADIRILNFSTLKNSLKY